MQNRVKEQHVTHRIQPQRIFQAAVLTIAALAGTILLMISIAAFPFNEAIYWTAAHIARGALLLFPVAMVIAVISGSMTLSRHLERRKRYRSAYMTHDERMQAILNQLAPDDRAYLEAELDWLRRARLSRASDGERLTLDDLVHEDADTLRPEMRQQNNEP